MRALYHSSLPTTIREAFPIVHRYVEILLYLTNVVNCTARKFTKAECLNSRYYATFSEFCQAITTCLHEPDEDQQARLRTLLTLKFQRFAKAG